MAADTQRASFAAKTISTQEMVALLGAHTVSAMDGRATHRDTRMWDSGQDHQHAGDGVALLGAHTVSTSSQGSASVSRNWGWGESWQ